MSVTVRGWWGIPIGIFLLLFAFGVMIGADPTFFFGSLIITSMVAGSGLLAVGIVGNKEATTVRLPLPNKRNRLLKQLQNAINIREELHLAAYKLPEENGLRMMLEQRKLQIEGTIEEIKTELGYLELGNLDKRAGKLIRR